MIDDKADVYGHKDEEANGVLADPKAEATDDLELAVSEAPKNSKNQERYRYAREHVLPLLLGMEDPEERQAALYDLADALNLKVKNLQKALKKMEDNLEEADDEDNPEEESSDDAGGPQADRLIAYAEEEVTALFLDQHDAVHALVSGEAIPLNGSRSHHWLRRLMWEREGKACRSDTLTTAAGTLAAKAEFSGDVRELHTRAAWHAGKLYYELFPGTVVEVDGAGWRQTTDCPVLFRRIKNLKALPTPVPGGSLDVLENLVNLKTKRDIRLFKVYAVTVMLPHIPRPILLATGAMGSGKTTVNRVIKRLVDPSAPESVRLDREFLQKASHGYLLLLDNQTGLPLWGADLLCRLVTGEADSKRRLFSDDDDIIYELKRAILLNGINVPTDRGDVLDRALAIELERIPDGERRPEEQLWEAFEAAHPYLLGALFEALSQALAILPTIASKLTTRPRLADWGGYAAAVYEAMGWGAELFAEDWSDVVKVQNQATLDASPVAQAVIKFMENKEEYAASSATLHEKLEKVAEDLGVTKDKEWPKSSRWLWRRIKEVLPLLSAVGIEASRKEISAATMITLRKVSKGDAIDATDASGPPEDPNGPAKGDRDDGLSPEDDPADEDDIDGDDEGWLEQTGDDEDEDGDGNQSSFWDDLEY